MEFVSDDRRVLFRTEEDGDFVLDVRALLLDGGEPYGHISTCVGQLAPGETLYLHAVFEPAPLIKKLHRQGFSTVSTHAGPDHWILSIQKTAP